MKVRKKIGKRLFNRKLPVVMGLMVAVMLCAISISDAEAWSSTIANSSKTCPLTVTIYPVPGVPASQTYQLSTKQSGTLNATWTVGSVILRVGMCVNPGNVTCKMSAGSMDLPSPVIDPWNTSGATITYNWNSPIPVAETYPITCIDKVN